MGRKCATGRPCIIMMQRPGVCLNFQKKHQRSTSTNSSFSRQQPLISRATIYLTKEKVNFTTLNKVCGSHYPLIYFSASELQETTTFGVYLAENNLVANHLQNPPRIQ